MVRRPGYIPKKRASGNREINRVLLVSVEGNKNNETERNYLQYWKDAKTKVRFVSGNETDPEKMMQRLIDEYKTYELTEKDLAVCLIDSDFSEGRNVVIAKVDAMAKSAAKEQLHLIVSSPCFEIWYICHFQYSTRQYRSADDSLSQTTRNQKMCMLLCREKRTSRSGMRRNWKNTVWRTERDFIMSNSCRVRRCIR